METGGQTGQLSLDVDGGSLVLLGEVDGSGDVLVVRAEDADSLDSHVVYVSCCGEGEREVCVVDGMR